MNNTKKVKLKNLNFYTINDNYINYISDLINTSLIIKIKLDHMLV